MKKSYSKLHFFLQTRSFVGIFKKSSVLNLWTRTILGVIINRNMVEEKETVGLDDPDVVVETKIKSVKKKKKRCFEQGGFDDPPFYDEFRPFWGPGSKYKPWKYGK